MIGPLERKSPGLNPAKKNDRLFLFLQNFQLSVNSKKLFELSSYEKFREKNCRNFVSK
jgi:hypothetical protein